jgi:hypothetical protein
MPCLPQGAAARYSAARFLTQPRKAASGILSRGLPERTHMARQSASSA